ncbi:MAG: glycosyltransferase family 2 protein [Eubacterium sp.]|nr:glycosyltransferase family 2 protein [Eubacterium sp.]
MDSHIKNKTIVKDLSIIVPAFNAEKTIAQCIKSVIEQKTKYDYELIVVNDGSTDSTQSILENICDKHLILINQENRGFSGARNSGIDASVGQYIMFLDSDDYLVGNCIDVMLDKIIEEKADIVQAGHYSFVDGDELSRNEVKLQSAIYDNTENMVHNPGYPWAKIYKRTMFHQLRFPLDVWFEDTIVCMILYRMCKKMVVMEDIVYAYRINPEGITLKARHSRKCVDHYWVMEYVLEQAKKNGLQNDDIQYDLIKGHMSTLLYRRISLMNKDVIEAAFILACELLDEVRPVDYIEERRFINKDIEKAFKTRNYKLWKLASFIV